MLIQAAALFLLATTASAVPTPGCVSTDPASVIRTARCLNRCIAAKNQANDELIIEQEIEDLLRAHHENPDTTPPKPKPQRHVDVEAIYKMVEPNSAFMQPIKYVLNASYTL